MHIFMQEGQVVLVETDNIHIYIYTNGRTLTNICTVYHLLGQNQFHYPSHSPTIFKELI